MWWRCTHRCAGTLLCVPACCCVPRCCPLQSVHQCLLLRTAQRFCGAGSPCEAEGVGSAPGSRTAEVLCSCSPVSALTCRWRQLSTWTWLTQRCAQPSRWAARQLLRLPACRARPRTWLARFAARRRWWPPLPRPLLLSSRAPAAAGALCAGQRRRLAAQLAAGRWHPATASPPDHGAAARRGRCVRGALQPGCGRGAAACSRVAAPSHQRRCATLHGSTPYPHCLSRAPPPLPLLPQSCHPRRGRTWRR